MLRKYDKNVCKCNSFLICLFFLLIYFFSPTLHFAKHESLQFGPDLNSLLQTTVWHNNMSEVRAVVLGRTRPSGYKNQKKVNSTFTFAHPGCTGTAHLNTRFIPNRRDFSISVPPLLSHKTLFDFCFSLFRC